MIITSNKEVDELAKRLKAQMAALQAGGDSVSDVFDVALTLGQALKQAIDLNAKLKSEKVLFKSEIDQLGTDVSELTNENKTNESTIKLLRQELIDKEQIMENLMCKSLDASFDMAQQSQSSIPSSVSSQIEKPMTVEGTFRKKAVTNGSADLEFEIQTLTKILSHRNSELKNTDRNFEAMQISIEEQQNLINQFKRLLTRYRSQIEYYREDLDEMKTENELLHQLNFELETRLKVLKVSTDDQQIMTIAEDDFMPLDEESRSFKALSDSLKKLEVSGPQRDTQFYQLEQTIDSCIFLVDEVENCERPKSTDSSFIRVEVVENWESAVPNDKKKTETGKSIICKFEAKTAHLLEDSDSESDDNISKLGRELKDLLDVL